MPTKACAVVSVYKKSPKIYLTIRRWICPCCSFLRSGALGGIKWALKLPRDNWDHFLDLLKDKKEAVQKTSFRTFKVLCLMHLESLSAAQQGGICMLQNMYSVFNSVCTYYKSVFISPPSSSFRTYLFSTLLLKTLIVITLSMKHLIYTAKGEGMKNTHKKIMFSTLQTIIFKTEMLSLACFSQKKFPRIGKLKTLKDILNIQKIFISWHLLNGKNRC